MSPSSHASASSDKINVLFCCLGNICRSPMALAVFEHTAVQAGVRDRFGTLDSAGTAHYHTGEEPDERTTALLQRRSIPYDADNTARGVTGHDFDSFDYIFGMDTNNVRNLQRMQPKGSKARVRLFGDVDDRQPIADSYYTGDFEATYKQVLRYSHAFLRELGLSNGGQAKS
ncbi:probable LTP1-protein-tyrosine-phosphatase [Sporisorium reilianum SRZ2]|uniref:Probable LTP1-protein-tyrosine-phosphatase n=2 Tax=Sporisorium reilianum TaxID=72558 RepID=E6ZZD0_SPORE|nr:probable LTP1-protein-tyrosine-phosphatase [Sporisorium reilianum SRZ2]SJX62441.1 probable LTP1-protein-tyrosine-phosphatase [Sporisorium reilianum f. sp. reilianum]